MKYNKLTFIIPIMLLLVACNNNDQAGENNPHDNNLNISSLRTDSNSQNYPETEPVKIQDKKYEFRTKPGQGAPNKQQGMNQQQPKKTIQSRCVATSPATV